MPSKGEKLKKFFKDLAENPERPGSLYERYLANPRQVMHDEGHLDPDVIDAVMGGKGGDLKFLNDLLRGSNIICGTIVRV
jgi:hypothetical protein